MRRRRHLSPLQHLLWWGTIACVGSGSGGGGTQHFPYLHNRTQGAVEVRITWVLRRIDCAATATALAATLGPSDLDDRRTMTLEWADVAALDGPPPAGTSSVGLCQTRPTQQFSNSTECVAAILEADGATPVLMMAPRSWVISGDTYICSPGPSTRSQCAPRLDPRVRIDADMLAIMDDEGRLRFDVSHAGRTQEGLVDSNLDIAPVDLAAIAARPRAADGCRETLDAYHALLQSSAACASDADCQTLPSLAIPGDTASCAIHVNKNVSTAAVEALRAQWTRACATAGQSCLPPLHPMCRQGTCADQCAGVALPICPPPCHETFQDAPVYPICPGRDQPCLNAAGQLCTCDNPGTICRVMPRIDPSCPFGCQPTPIDRAAAPAPIPDSGAPVPDGGV